MPSTLKSSKKAKVIKGFKAYRDSKGRFITKVAWQALSKNKRKSSSVSVKRDKKGRFLSEKFLSPTVKVTPEKKKKKKAKPKPKPEKCNFRSVIEIVNQHEISKYNVTGVENLSIHCLSELIDNQISRGAYLFRFWYRGNSYYKYTDDGLIRSTSLISVVRLRQDFPTTKKFLQSLGGPVIFYWMNLRVRGY